MLTFAVVALAGGVVALTVTWGESAAGGGLTLARAEGAARKEVLHHPSYERIESRLTGLRTRRCRRAARSSVRCRLYVVVPSPCSLGVEKGMVCVQALWERRWLVEVRVRRGAPAARLLEVSAGPAAGDVP